MDLINWKKFCKTYNVKYLDSLSDKAKNIVKQYIFKNVQYKGLQRILYLYYHPLKLTKCNIISPLYSLSYHTSSIYNKDIYIFGEHHNSIGTCKIKDDCNTFNFIIDQISIVPKMMDVFLETPYIHKTGKYLLYKDPGILSKFRINLQNCLDIKKECQYPNIRFHNADIRLSIGIKRPFILDIEETMIGLYYDMYLQRGNFSYNYHKKHLLNLLTLKKYKNDRIEYDKAIKSYDTSMEYLLKKFSKIKLEKQQKNISNKNVKQILLEYLIDSIRRIDLKYLQLNVITNIIKKLPKNIPKIVPTEFNSSNDNLLDLLVPIMDMYLIARMFRTFKDVPYQNSKEAQYIIIYVGDAHANNYRDILDKLNFKTEFYSRSQEHEFCVDISKLQLPLFS